MPHTLTVASVNLHAGIDGWGRPFDAVAACLAMNADILLIQENWADNGEPSIAQQVAEAAQSAIVETTYATGRRGHPMPNATAKWLSSKGFFGHDHSLYFDSAKALSQKVASRQHFKEASPGAWGTAIVSKLPMTSTSVLELPYLRRDRSHRRPLVATVDVNGEELTIVCVHMSHLTYGSVLHFNQFNKSLRSLGVRSKPIIVGGDMNNWGPPVLAQVRGVRRAVRGRTWPAWKPHSQLDHLLVSEQLDVVSAAVLSNIGSDHLPVTATIRLR